MPQFMVRITGGAQHADEALAEPRRLFSAVRDAASDMGGNLDGCWFANGGRELLAIFRAPARLDREDVEATFRRIGWGLRVDVQALQTLRELERRPTLAEAVVRIDPVDLGSELSFPASDPPTWRPS